MSQEQGWTTVACEECGCETKVLIAFEDGRLRTAEEHLAAQNVLGLAVVCEDCRKAAAAPVELGGVQRMIESEVL
jgi:hypothetical protein